jgi:hypothetical protein
MHFAGIVGMPEKIIDADELTAGTAAPTAVTSGDDVRARFEKNAQTSEELLGRLSDEAVPWLSGVLLSREGVDACATHRGAADECAESHLPPPRPAVCVFTLAGRAPAACIRTDSG